MLLTSYNSFTFINISANEIDEEKSFMLKLSIGYGVTMGEQSVNYMPIACKQQIKGSNDCGPCCLANMFNIALRLDSSKIITEQNIRYWAQFYFRRYFDLYDSRLYLLY